MQRNLRRWGAGVGLVATGAVAGGILASTLSASADTGTAAAPSSSSSSSSTGGSSSGTGGEQATDPSKPQRSDETLLTGDTKSRVEAAVLAEYPGATIERTETDSEGVYESHVVTTDGQHLIVQVGSDFAVTGTQSGPGAGGGRGHRGGGGAPSGSPGTSGSSGASGSSGSSPSSGG